MVVWVGASDVMDSDVHEFTVVHDFSAQFYPGFHLMPGRCFSAHAKIVHKDKFVHAAVHNVKSS